jgi:site-specific DNA-methyltransferase (adenine-specific)
MTTYFVDVNHETPFDLFHGDCRLHLADLLFKHKFNFIFADPPYFLSGGGTTNSGGKRVSVQKGEWDTPQTLPELHKFNASWIGACKRVLHPDGSIMISGTLHNIFSVGMCLLQLGFKIINVITWFKPNAAPNLSCKTLTHSSEFLIWAAMPDATYTFNYSDLKTENHDRQLRDVWTFNPPGPSEKRHGKHPTQKPLALLNRILRMATKPGDLVLDPFNGSGTTGLAAHALGRSYIGIDQYAKYLDLTIKRFKNPVPIIDEPEGEWIVLKDLLEANVQDQVRVWCSQKPSVVVSEEEAPRP